MKNDTVNPHHDTTEWHVVNLVLPSLHGGSLQNTLTAPLNYFTTYSV